MGVVKQYALFKISQTQEGFGNVHDLSLKPESEKGKSGKLAVFPTEEDALEEVTKLITPYSSTRYTIIPVYGDSKMIEAIEVR